MREGSTPPTCHVLCVTGRMSCVTSHMAHVACHIFFKVSKLVFEGLLSMGPTLSSFKIEPPTVREHLDEGFI